MGPWPFPLTEKSWYSEKEIADGQLRMMFACCHPALSRESQVALTLKTLGGLSVREIARAFLTDERATAQRLVRAKRTLREARVRFAVPAPDELPARLDAVLETLYLLFNEGYTAHAGDALTRAELCHEAIRLGEILVRHPAGDAPPAWALLALMLLQASRLPSRVDGRGDLLLLREQDRSRWDRALIRRGLQCLERAAAGDRASTYHLEAGIAACHAAAPSYEATDWRAVLDAYDGLLAQSGSPVVALNRAIAVAMVHGAAAGIAELERLRGLPVLDSYHLLPAALGALHAEAGDAARAAACYREALGKTESEPERRFLERKLREVGA